MRGIEYEGSGERGAEAGGATAHGKTGTGHNAHAVRTAAILNLQPHVMDQATRRFDFSQLFIYYEMKRIITESHSALTHTLTSLTHSLTHNAIRAGARSAAKHKQTRVRAHWRAMTRDSLYIHVLQTSNEANETN